MLLQLLARNVALYTALSIASKQPGFSHLNPSARLRLATLRPSPIIHHSTTSPMQWFAGLDEYNTAVKIRCEPKRRGEDMPINVCHIYVV